MTDVSLVLNFIHSSSAAEGPSYFSCWEAASLSCVTVRYNSNCWDKIGSKSKQYVKDV